jgi:hypothetical protein
MPRSWRSRTRESFKLSTIDNFLHHVYGVQTQIFGSGPREKATEKGVGIAFTPEEPFG